MISVFDMISEKPHIADDVDSNVTVSRTMLGQLSGFLAEAQANARRQEARAIQAESALAIAEQIIQLLTLGH